MNYLAKLCETTTRSLLGGESFLFNQIRGKAVKSKGHSRNPPKNKNHKRRGIKANDGSYVPKHSILATQFVLRFHPGLNVGFGRNGTLFATKAGRVVVTCERMEPNWDRSCNQRAYAGREDQAIYKKYFNVIPLEQHNRFKLIDQL